MMIGYMIWYSYVNVEYMNSRMCLKENNVVYLLLISINSSISKDSYFLASWWRSLFIVKEQPTSRRQV